MVLVLLLLHCLRAGLSDGLSLRHQANLSKVLLDGELSSKGMNQWPREHRGRGACSGCSGAGGSEPGLCWAERITHRLRKDGGRRRRSSMAE